MTGEKVMSNPIWLRGGYGIACLNVAAQALSDAVSATPHDLLPSWLCWAAFVGNLYFGIQVLRKGVR